MPTADDRGAASAPCRAPVRRRGPLRLRARNEGAWGNRLRAGLASPPGRCASTRARFAHRSVNCRHGSTSARARCCGSTLGGGVARSSASWRRRLAIAVAAAGRLDDCVGHLRPRGERAAAGDRDRRSGARDRRRRRTVRALRAPRRFRRSTPALARQPTLATNRRSSYPDRRLASIRPCSARQRRAVVATPSDVGSLRPAARTATRDITPEDFFDRAWALGDDEPGSGVHALTQLVRPVAAGRARPLLAVSARAEPRRLDRPVSLAGPDVRALRRSAAAAAHAGAPPADLRRACGSIRRCRTIWSDHRAAARGSSSSPRRSRSFVVLLDVPPGLSQRRILGWRARFNSSYAAAYHPWLVVRGATTAATRSSAATRRRSRPASSRSGRSRSASRTGRPT